MILRDHLMDRQLLRLRDGGSHGRCRLAGEMTIEGLGETVRKINDRLEAIDSKLTSMDSPTGSSTSRSIS